MTQTEKSKLIDKLDSRMYFVYGHVSIRISYEDFWKWIADYQIAVENEFAKNLKENEEWRKAYDIT